MSRSMDTLLGLAVVPTVTVKLRPYQDALVRRVCDVLGTARQDGTFPQRVLVVLPTGGGKTVAFATMAHRTVLDGGTVLILAHRQELITQAYDKLVDPAPRGCGIPPAMVGVIMGKDARRNPSAPIQVASVDTLRARVARAGRGAPKPAEGAPEAPKLTAGQCGLPPATVIFPDEAHRAVTEGHAAILAMYPDAFVVGWSASPIRLDGQGMDEQFEELVEGATVEQLIAEGYLVMSRCYSHPVKPDTKAVRTRNGDFDEKDAASVMDTPALIGHIVDHWLKHSGLAPTFVFASSVQHSRNIAARFVAQGVPAVHVDGDTPVGERKQALADLRSGRIRVVVNCNLFLEGTDVPEVKCVVLARLTKSLALYLQAVGRGQRVLDYAPEVRTLVVLDHAGCRLRHKAPETVRDWKKVWTGRSQSDVGDDVPEKECPGCMRPISAFERVCPECDYLFGEEPGERRAVAEVDGELAEIVASESARKRELRRVLNLKCGDSDKARGRPFGFTNRVINVEWNKPRDEMTTEDLQAAIKWLEGPAFAREFPLPSAMMDRMGERR